MKMCTRCNTERHESEFYLRNGKGKRKLERYSYCKPCFIKYVTTRWIRLKQEAIEYKGGQCQDCSGVFHYAVYDFHHRDPSDKEDNWVQIRKHKPDVRKRELDKCDLLCANCHRMRHVNMSAVPDISLLS